MRFVVFALCLVVSPAFAIESPGERERILMSQAGASAPRALGDVQRVVDNHKGSIYALYARALREKPGLQGDIRLSISIAPDGTVTKCTVASSTLKDPAFEKQLVERFSTIQFGAKGHTVYSNPGFPFSFYSLAKK